ncbi:MAG: MipA/OmpV family protein [Kordiimonadaceae bacterium]|nr:MipA/OmpV family protein [Kordiimonadaceae bacterium]
MKIHISTPILLSTLLVGNICLAEEKDIPANEGEGQSNTVNEQDSNGLWNYKKFLLDENGKWSLGFGTVVSNSPFKGEKISVTPIPVVDYSSKNLFIRGLRGGYHIKKVENPREGGYFLDVFLSPRIRPGDSRRKISLDGGVSGGYQSIAGTVTLSMLHDISAQSGGMEINASYSFPYQTPGKKFLFIPKLEITYQSEGLANYLWGIDNKTYLKSLANLNEVTLEPYRITTSVFNISASMTHVYRIDDHWNTLFLAKITALDGDIMDNPAIERQFDYSFIIGTAYTF